MAIGSTSSAEFLLQDGPTGGPDVNWGWTDNGWGVPGKPIYFQDTGTHRLRVQQREDGAIIDQIVLSPTTYLLVPPGIRTDDATILPATPPSAGTCTYTLSTAGSSMVAAGGHGTVTVTTQAGCSWTAATTTPWITVTSASSSTGSGAAAFSVAANSATATRIGTMTIAGQTYSVTQEAAPPTPCTGTLSSPGSAFGPGAASGSVNVTADTTCTWSAATTTSWIVLTSAAQHTGNASVTFDVSANTGAARSGTIALAGAVYTVTQEAVPAPLCSVTLSAASATVGAGAGGGSVGVIASDPSCAWSATTTTGWITVAGGSPGSGSGTVTYSVLPNPDSTARSGTLSIGGQTFTLTQDAATPPPVGTCAVTLDKTSMIVGANEANWTITVTADTTCAWTASSDMAWLVVKTTTPTAMPVSGNGLVKVKSITNTSPKRVGHFVINGVVYTVTQGGGTPPVQ
jgi:hypothetical protein